MVRRGILPAPGVRFINKIDMNIDMTKAEFFRSTEEISVLAGLSNKKIGVKHKTLLKVLKIGLYEYCIFYSR